MANDCGTWCKVCGKPILFKGYELEQDHIKWRAWQEQLCLDCLAGKPRTADEIRAEYERLERDLLATHQQQLIDLHQDWAEQMQALFEQRAAELAEVEGGE